MAGMIDRLRSPDAPRKTAWIALAAGMVLSTLAILLFGRSAFFTVDEHSWISSSASFDFNQAFDPYVGHLVVIPKTIYWLVLETVGLRSYVFFQMLTLASLFLMAGLMFEWLRNRVPPFVALAPVLIVLIFPVDHLHYLTGNGVAIALALAFGTGALLAWDRCSSRGDLIAFALLVLGLMTYTIAAPFAIGILIAALLTKQWGRVWVGLLPILAYALWRLVSIGSSVEKLEGGPDWDNLLLLPAWSFQSLGAVLAALTGLDFDFSNVAGGPALEQGRVLGPVLATTALLALGWWFWRGRRVDVGFWLTGSILLALFASQVVVWGTIDARDPGAPRYLLPGAVIVTLVVAALLRGVEWKRTPFVALWLLTASSLIISIGILVNNTSWLETVERGSRAEVTAITLLENSRKEPLPPRLQPRDRVRPDFSSRKASKYGNLGFSEEALADEPGWVGKRVDSFIAESLTIRLGKLPEGTRPKNCRPALSGSKATYRNRVQVRSPGAILTASEDVSLLLGRFGPWPVVELGTLPRNESRRLRLPFDTGKRPWYLKASPTAPGTLADIGLCPLP